MSLLKKIEFTSAEKFLLILLACLAPGYWWVSGHVWFRIDNHKISINGSSLAEGSDYSCFKSLGGNIFCYQQDHGTPYYISPENNVVSVICDNVDVTNLDVLLISSGARTGFGNSDVKQRLYDPRLIVGSDFVEFTPSVTEWKSPEVQRRRISY